MEIPKQVTICTKHLTLVGLVLFTLQGCADSAPAPAGQEKLPPNIVFILADDLGYGDVSFLNRGSKISTPHMDNLAAAGMVFRDAHSGSAVCTPTRYGILTGRYAWRSRLKSGVLWGYSPPLIESGRTTVASFLKKQGYSTACVGKWHLGLGWHTRDGTVPSDRPDEQGEAVDFSKPIGGGPTAAGFDYFFGVPASLDMDPYVYVENDRVVEQPTLTVEANEPGREGFWRAGPIAPGFKHLEVLPTLTEKALDFIEHHAQSTPAKPFFLYFALTAPHTPVLPNPPFRGKSQAGRYGDFVVEVDSTVGQVAATLERLGIAENTLLIVTSDNGPERHMLPRKEEFDHASNHPFRGMKRDSWEGGHRVPFLARWPTRIAAGTHSDETICLTDLMATAADIVGAALPQGAGEDSYSILPTLLGHTRDQPIRQATIHHSSRGEFAIRQGRWKLIEGRGSGGNPYPSGPNATKPEDPPRQLYDLEEDVGETENLVEENPERADNLSEILETYRTSGRTPK